MNSYGKDIKMAFFNAPEEARFKLFKLIESPNTSTGDVTYILLSWTTMGLNAKLMGQFPNVELGLQEFNKQVERWRENEPQFKLVAES